MAAIQLKRKKEKKKKVKIKETLDITARKSTVQVNFMSNLIDLDIAPLISKFNPSSLLSLNYDHSIKIPPARS